MGYVCGRRQQPLDQPHMGTAVRTAKTSPASWDAFSDVEAFVDEVLTELARRFHRDRLRFDPVSAPEAPRNRRAQRLTSTNRH